MLSTPVLIVVSLVVPPLWAWGMYWLVIRFWPVKPAAKPAVSPPVPRDHHDIDYHI